MSQGNPTGGKVPPHTSVSNPTFPVHILAADLDDRQIRGVNLWEAAQKSNGLAIPVNDELTMYCAHNRAWQCVRSERNRRGVKAVEYRCGCPDFKKNGRVDCYHVFAEKLRRGEVVIDGSISRTRRTVAVAQRRPARKRYAADGRSMRTVQRTARTKIPARIPELIASLKQVHDREHPKVRSISRGPRAQVASSRAAALVFKVAERASADTMKARFKQLIESRMLRLRSVPHQNTLSKWMNDPTLTPILHSFLATSSRPFRKREIAAMVDSTKLSQMRTAHSRYVEYGDDVRDGADWMKCHVLAGVETMIVMAAAFSGSRGAGTHDINFALDLVKTAQKVFPLRYLLGDKAYLAEHLLGDLWNMGIQAIIPIKIRWDLSTKSKAYEACEHLVKWFDDRQADFHEHYRLRPKIESLFAHFKNVADGYCWSRGRRRKGLENADAPCVAWINEALCKLIYVNLRTTVRTEEETGYTMNLLSDSFFPAIADEDKLIAA